MTVANEVTNLLLPPPAPLRAMLVRYPYPFLPAIPSSNGKNRSLTSAPGPALQETFVPVDVARVSSTLLIVRFLCLSFSQPQNLLQGNHPPPTSELWRLVNYYAGYGQVDE